MADGDFRRRATELHLADLLRSAAPDIPGLVDRFGIVRSPEDGDISCEEETRPTRTSQTVLPEGACVTPKFIEGTDAFTNWVASIGFVDVGTSGLDQYSS